jgi:RHS repeat-associated protein
VTFAYDPFGRRIKKVVSSTSATSVFAYDGDNLVEEANSSGAAVARYSQGLNIDEPLAMLRSSATSYYNADGLGSVTSLANASGTLAQTYTFDSFGKQTASSGSLVNPFQYTGRESDPETGLYYYRARYYDSTTSKFLNEDESMFEGGIDFYTYVSNNPVMFVDPYGLDRLSYDQISDLVAANNKSGQTNELIICIAYKESNFDPDADRPGFQQSARGLMAVTDAVATDMGVDYEQLHDPALNIATGSGYLGRRIRWSRGNVGNGLMGYGTGKPSYANSLLKCEKCLITRAAETSECKTKNCLEPLHPAPPHKPKPRPRARHPRKPKS